MPTFAGTAVTRAVAHQPGRNLKLTPPLPSPHDRIIFLGMVLPRIPPALTRLRVKPDEPADGPPAVDAADRPRAHGGRIRI